jgi:type IV pilus assembly protein PilB
MSIPSSIYTQNLQLAINKSDIVKVFDNLLTIGVENGASDIHIEPYENYCRIRLRIDGVLDDIMQYPKTLHANVIAKFKIESWQMRPDEQRIPQDARVSTITLTSKEIDLRANTLPTVWWEKLVMRIVDKSKKTPPLEALGIEWSNGLIMARNLTYPNGIIINSWPTGSGKTTTLYAALDKVNRVGINITTYEDPVESRIDWLNQSQIRADIGYKFADGLRASLRQDPDIVMVGEIRDWETLETAMEAAMTGHLVFSTIHTNSSAETITRVMNMGALSYQITGTFNLVIAQRLCRKACDQCKVYQTMDDPKRKDYLAFARDSLTSMKSEALTRELELRNIDDTTRKRFFEEGKIIVWPGKLADGSVCPKCNGNGYKWRVGVYEMMEYDDEIKNLLLQGKTALDVEAYALKNGMMNLERDGIFKSIEWQTTLEEIYRIVKHKWLDKEKQDEHTANSAQAQQQAAVQQAIEAQHLEYGQAVQAVVAPTAPTASQ